MKKIFLATMLLASPGAVPSLAADLPHSIAAIHQGSHICLRSDRILGRTILDNSTIVFRMNDGTYWKNALQKPCPGLAMRDGFAFRTRDNYICSNQQPITVLNEGTVCFLGEFTQTDSPVKPAH
jgi:hypothetical protein